MNLALLIPLGLGVFGILQGTLNKQFAQTVGIAQATFIGCIITLIASAALYFAVKASPQFFPEFFHVKVPLLTWKWWYIVPGLFGLLIVAGLPFAFAKLGAVKVTVGLIAAQMITSSLWDVFIEHIPLSWTKLLGMGFAFLSVLLIIR
jgi:bacterial/archaeal transporter family-2 protein